MNEFKLVPVEPTEEMATAAMNAETTANMLYGEPASFIDIWNAMLAAAPAVQGEPVFMWHRGATGDESEVVDVDCACPCCVPLYAAPQPAEQHPDVSKLVEALEDALASLEEYAVMVDGEWGCCRNLGQLEADDELPQCVKDARAALAAYRKQGGEK